MPPAPVAEITSLVAGTCPDPHRLLGVHEEAGRTVVRAWRPGASAATLEGRPMRRIHDAGLFEVPVESAPVPGYRVTYSWDGGGAHTVVEPWGLWPTLGELDIHLLGEGRHERLWTVLGAHPRVHEGVDGTAFAVWAPAARAVRVVGDWNGWDGRVHPMRRLGTSGVWEIFVPEAGPGQRYKYEVLGADGRLRLKADPLATATEAPPGTASVIFRSSHAWGDAEWLARRAASRPTDERLAVYEVHLGSWRRHPDGAYLDYHEVAERLADHVVALGFTHVELLPPTEHPYDPSWGYQVSSYFAPTARFGAPDGFRSLVDHLHQRGIGVLVDWVPASFPRDDWALARFDGTALYEHADPRQGEHPDWGTLVFNFGRHEVRNFLVASARFWLEEMHADGMRVDAVASMLYLDYSRRAGEWVPNVHGGRENLDAVAFLRELNTLVHRDHPGVLTVAEESTAWGGVSAPVDAGGLGFSQKWNMGWMHDTLEYFRHEPLHRRWHHDLLTFGLTYAWSERYVLPFSHDEVVHLKGSLLGKMPGDRWQRFANLRALYAWMWAHPGKQLLFMGAELAQEREWSQDRELDWYLLDDPFHSGVRDLVGELNRVAAGQPALWSADTTPAGFAWLDADDREHSVYSFLRLAGSGDGTEVVACVANLTPVPRHGYRVGLPRAGRWIDVLNTDEARWGGSGVVQPEVHTDGTPWQGQPDSAVLTLPPLAVRWLAPGREA
ncbi:MAG TPA: 1,4-alpha-glucan branching protein GlgB [Acidimicrobiales bacterium]|jgi:1,4-alpha-glucan branching enzyme|nr:1,4-alpha-glucan branching protein GlgB [Acidimicrobiales bacterium]